MPTIKENLEALIAAVEAYPHIDLDSIKRDAPCGTLYCSAGIVGSTPFFRDQGFCLVHERLRYFLSLDGESVAKFSDLDPYFGHLAWWNVFASYGDGNWDVDLIDDNPNHKTLALRRLRLQLEEHS